MRKIKLLIYTVLFSLVLISCKKEDVGGSTEVAAKTSIDEKYGALSVQKMDVYLPANRSSASTKSFIFIHGGGWQEGDKADFNQFLDTFRILFPDYGFFNINYSLYNGASHINKFPTQENDVRLAVTYISNNRESYGVSDKFVLLGASAGGHLAMLQAYKANLPKIKAVVNFFGPADMADMYNNPASPLAPRDSIAVLFDGTPTMQPLLYFSSSPINAVNAGDPPTIILQGGIDPLVRPAQQIALKAKLDAAGVVNQYVFYPTESHGWVGTNLTDSYLKIRAFVNANVQ